MAAYVDMALPSLPPARRYPMVVTLRSPGLRHEAKCRNLQ